METPAAAAATAAAASAPTEAVVATENTPKGVDTPRPVIVRYISQYIALY